MGRTARAESEIRTRDQKTTRRITDLDQQLTTAWTGFVKNRMECGRILWELHDLLAGEFKSHLQELNFAPSTAYDLLADYKRVHELPKIVVEMATEMGVDIAAAKYASTIEANRHMLRTPLSKTAARDFVNKLIDRGTRVLIAAGLTKYQRRQHDAYRSLVALGDRPENGGNLSEEFAAIVAAAAYDLGIEKEVVVRPQEGPRWMTQRMNKGNGTAA